jgi:hypothetical protein
MAILKMGGKAILITVLAGIIIGVIGYTNKWDTSMAYSNAFFIAGCLMIVAGTAARLSASQAWKSFQQIHAESFNHMSNSERVNFIIETSSPISLVILGLSSGIILILLAVLVTKWF